MNYTQENFMMLERLLREVKDTAIPRSSSYPHGTKTTSWSISPDLYRRISNSFKIMDAQ